MASLSSSGEQAVDQKPIEDLLDDEEEFEDETVSERLLALTEILPESVRWAASSAASGSYWLAGWSFSKASSLLWIATTTGIIAALPLIIERERVSMEEADLMNERKMMLGPGGMPPSAAFSQA